MDQALPTLIFLGVGIVALILILVGLGAGARSRTAHDGQLAAPGSPTWRPSPSAPEPVRLLPENDGTVSVEVDGRRFGRLEEMVDERQVARVRAAAAGLRQFVENAPAPSPLGQNDWRDEARIGRLKANGDFAVEWGGRQYRQWAELPDAARPKLLELLSALAAFAPEVALPSASVAPPPPPSPERELFDRLAAPEPAPRASFLERMGGTTSKPSPAPVGIAGQVEQILQQQLLDNTTLRGWSVHVVTATDGSLAIEVEGRRLAWPEGVPAGPVREAVQKAIRMWERSF